MDAPKAIFIDVDGTLLSHKTKQVPKSAIDALQYAHEKGALLFIATGRHKKELARIICIDDLPMDGFVTMNGGCCYVGDEVIFKKPLHPETIACTVERMVCNPFPCMFCEEDEMYINMIDELKSLDELKSIIKG